MQKALGTLPEDEYRDNLRHLSKVSRDDGDVDNDDDNDDVDDDADECH
jgi:hypothetical protein